MNAVDFIAPTPNWYLETVVSGLKDVRRKWRESRQRPQDVGGRELPSWDAVGDIVNNLCGALFPMRLGPPDLRQESEDFYIGHTLDAALNALLLQVRLELRYAQRYVFHESPDLGHNLDVVAERIVRAFAQTLPEVRQLLDSDVEAAFRGDPAATCQEVDLMIATLHRLARGQGSIRSR